MDNCQSISRSPYGGEKQWLRVIEKTTIEKTSGKKFFGHGNLTNREQGGNGYHGNCENCGLALVTDLGYNSWEDTKCEVKAKEITNTETSFRWFKSENYATKLNPEKTEQYFFQLIHEQGWGTYNFQMNPEADY